MGQPFCAFDFKRRDGIEEAKKRDEKGEKNEVENPREEFHRRRGIARG